MLALSALLLLQLRVNGWPSLMVVRSALIEAVGRSHAVTLIEQLAASVPVQAGLLAVSVKVWEPFVFSLTV